MVSRCIVRRSIAEPNSPNEVILGRQPVSLYFRHVITEQCKSAESVQITHAKRVTNGKSPAATIRTRQPLPVIIRPIFRCRPLFVRGIPIARDIFDLSLLIPKSRFHENPPLFIKSSFRTSDLHKLPSILPSRLTRKYFVSVVFHHHRVNLPGG